MTPYLLLTRPMGPSLRFLGDLPRDLRRRVVPVIAPLLEIVHLPVGKLAAPQGLIFSSENGVAAARNAGLARPGMKAWCVGARTAEAASDAGLDAVACGGTAAQMLDHLLAERPAGRLLHPRGRHAAVEIAGALTEAGLDVHEAILYDQVARPLAAVARAALHSGAPVLAPVFSARTARLLVEALDAESRANLLVLCISPAVARVLAGSGLALRTSATPDARGLADLVAEALGTGPAP